MKVLVAVKRTIDPNVKVRVKSDQTGVETANVKMAMNPFCEIAVEEAVRMKENGPADEVIVVSAGADKTQETLRTALAMGADRAVHIVTEAELQPLAVARLLQGDRGRGAAGPRHPGQAGHRRRQQPDRPDAGGAARLAAGDFRVRDPWFKDGTADVTREIDGGLETLNVNLPAVVTTDLRLNEPRYASLPNIMKAKKKPIDRRDADTLGVDISPRLAVHKVEEPPKREAGIKVADVSELVAKLRDDAKVIG